MAYLGNAPARSFISFERQVFTIVNSQTAYTLDHSVNNENDIRLVVNNIVQEPGSGKAYTASGTTLTLSAALTNGTDEMYCVFLGRAVATNAPGAGSVGASQLASDAVTAAKLNDDIISGQTALGATPADTDEFLVSDAGTIKRVDYSYLKGGTNTPYFMAYRNASLSISHATFTTVVYDAEDLDSGSGFNLTTGQYTVPEAGKYFFQYVIRSTANSDTNSVRIFTKGERTGSASTTWGNGALDFRANYGRAGSVGGSVIMNCAANDVIYTQIYHQTVDSGNVDIEYGSSRSTYFMGFKIIE